MRTKKLLILLGSVCLALVLAVPMVAGCVPAPTEEFPSKPIQLIGPYSAGGGTDRTSRVIAGTWPLYSDVALRVVVMPGAGGAEGCRFVADSEPDGYTLLAESYPHTLFIAMWRDVGYTAESFIPIVSIGSSPLVLTVHPDAPFDTLEELIAAAKAQPNGLTYGTIGAGTLNHIGGELWHAKAGIELKNVPFDGASEAHAALLGKHIDYFMGTTAMMLPSVESGALRGLAVAGTERLEDIPDVPTFRECGVDFDIYLKRVIWAPVGIPQERLDILDQIFEQVATDKGFQKLLAKVGEKPEWIGTAELQVIVTKTIQESNPVIEALKAKAGLK